MWRKGAAQVVRRRALDHNVEALATHGALAAVGEFDPGNPHRERRSLLEPESLIGLRDCRQFDGEPVDFCR
jgi:hypothetical protein